MYVNYQHVVERVLAVVASKPHHGQRDLLVAIGNAIEAETMDDDAYAEFLSRFGEEVAEAVANKLPTDHALIRPDAASPGQTQGDVHPIASGEGDTACPTSSTLAAPRPSLTSPA